MSVFAEVIKRFKDFDIYLVFIFIFKIRYRATRYGSRQFFLNKGNTFFIIIMLFEEILRIFSGKLFILYKTKTGDIIGPYLVVFSHKYHRLFHINI